MEEDFKQKHQYMLNIAQREGINEDNSENMDEKLLQRLMACANQHDESRASKAISHEEWVRRKEHEIELKKKLIREA